jgi:hypothetical protein
VIQKLAPLPDPVAQAAVIDDAFRLTDDGIANFARVGAPKGRIERFADHRIAGTVRWIRGRRHTDQSSLGRAPVGVVEIVAGAVDRAEVDRQ